MSYENFKPVQLRTWIDNETRLNAENMNELRDAVQASADAILDRNGNGIVSDIQTLDQELESIRGEEEDSIVNDDGSVNMNEDITLHSLRNAVDHYAVRWQSM